MRRLFPRIRFNRYLVNDFLRRVDRIAADLNVLLVVIAIGLAALDMTFLLTQKIIDHLPQAAHASQQGSASSRQPATGQGVAGAASR